MSNAGVFEIHSGRGALAVLQPFPFESSDDLPDVPALPETLLQMELKLHEFSFDLDEVSQLVLNDPGATLQILRLAAREFAPEEGRPSRMADCISCFGLDECLRAAGQRTVLSEARHRGVVELWAHSREIAHLCRRLAPAVDAGISPDDAYLVGLTHTLPLLPAILGWQGPEKDAGNAAGKGLRLAQVWSLPACVLQSFAESSQPGVPSRWTTLLHKAHGRSRASARCSMSQAGGPRLCLRD